MTGLGVVGDITEIELRAELEQAIEQALTLSEETLRKVSVRTQDEELRALAFATLAVFPHIRSLRRALQLELAG